MMVRWSKGMLLLSLAALASCGYFDPLNPTDPGPPDRSVTWSAKLGSLVKNVGRSVLETSDGGLIFIGTIESSRENGDDLWLLKTDAAGREKWSKTFGGAGVDTGNCLQATPDGGYILLGSTRSMGAGGSDVYLVKTDANGNWQWDKTYGGSADDCGYSIQCIDGGYIIAGSTGSSGAGKDDAYLIKVDMEGKGIWEKTFGGPCADVGYSVRGTSDNGFVIAGCKQPVVDGDDTAWLVKTDSGGNLEWEQLYGEIASSTADLLLEQAKDVQLTADGGYVLAGHNHPAGGDFDGWLIKTNAKGEEEWSQAFGGGAWDQVEAVVLTADGGYALAGMSRSYGPWEQAWLVKTDGAGKQEWEKHFGGSDEEWAYGLLQTANEGYILIGTTSGNGHQAYLVYHKPWIETP